MKAPGPIEAIGNVLLGTCQVVGVFAAYGANKYTKISSRNNNG